MKYMLKLVVAAMLVALSIPAYAQDDKAMMDAMMKAAAPSEQHALLAKLAGRWTTTVKAWMAPGQAPVESAGSAEITMTLGGRFYHEQFKGDFMGMPFEGVGFGGYDNVTKKFQATWADTMGTGLMLMKGDYDPATKSFTYMGEFTDPMGKPSTMKIVQKWVDADTHVSEFYETAAPGQPKIMEITYKRAK